MAKKKNEIIFKCNNCGHSQPKWLGRCPDCGQWNSFVEHSVASVNDVGGLGIGSKSTTRIKPMSLVKVDPMEGERLFSGISEFDRVLGGGAMKSSAVLIGGEPGIGKSTLLLQTLAAISENSSESVLYVSGEESASQVRSRADRLGLDCKNIKILCTTRLEDIEEAFISINPVFVVIDSIQTVYSAEAGLVPGTVNQLKYCANELISWVKENDAVMFLVAHVTKEGAIAGPKSLEHMVDTVISFDRNDDEIRFLRAQKNRFGSIDELGIFSMGEKGLTPVEDPSTMFITRRSEKLPAGVAVAPVFEGSRVFLVEIQALCVPAKSTITRVYSDRIDNNRVSRIAAVLEKRAGLKFSDQDLYINVAGGIKLTESAIDGALAAALYSARTDVSLPESTVVVGELSLAGEIRPVPRLKQRVKTAQSLGFMNILAPEKETGVQEIQNIKQLVQALF
ncbi:MAG: DNA repair protein RadA [Treponema sp.]|jgi:DNA repair protein RadA/Sms|nr:DNA repair protein RadA [Treponema sp.]